MREIKFRVWKPEEKRWVSFPERGLNSFEPIIDPVYTNGNYFIIQQYTGIKDKHGHEIYEGDYLKDSNEMLYEVLWLDTHASFELVEKQELPDDYPTPKFGFLWVSELSVVGNIFQNPELLEKHD